MKGTVEGNTTLRKICHSDAPKLLAALRRFCGVVFTPSRQLMSMGNTAPRKMIPTLDGMPMPNQMMISGKSATRGVAFIALTKGSKVPNRHY